jgi:uncharacterized protein (TIGR01777 family)
VIRFELASELPVSAEAAYTWHTRPGALERLVPPWEKVRVVERRGEFEDSVVVLDVPLGPGRGRWVAHHREVVPGRQFVDEQVEGPFARWTHTHSFEPAGPDRCRYVDRIVYKLPFGPAGALGERYVRRRLERSFRYRHTTVRDDLAAQRRAAGLASLTIAVTGASGFIGRTLIPFLTTAGHRVRRLVRREAIGDDILWNPAERRLEPAALEGIDAVIHLAGEPIAGRWTRSRRRRVLESRSDSTALLVETLAGLRRPPRVFLSASGIGIYGHRSDKLVTEETHLRTGGDTMFVEQIGQAWEGAAAQAERAGIRAAQLRLGMVLSPAGGALAKMLPAFRAGVAGRLGNGRQYVSWIGIDDAVGALYHVLVTDQLKGPVNLTSPEPVTNAEFTAALGEVLGRPTVLPVPAVALWVLFGDMANELLLASCRVLPSRLQESGYLFRHPDLRGSLRHVLGRGPDSRGGGGRVAPSPATA